MMKCPACGNLLSMVLHCGSRYCESEMGIDGIESDERCRGELMDEFWACPNCSHTVADSKEDALALMNRVISANLDIDWDLLRQQKVQLLEIQEYVLKSITPPHRWGETVEGIIGVLDSLQDQAAGILGEEAIFGKSEENDD